VNDLATLNGRPKRHVIKGEVYRIFPQTLRTLSRFQEWIDMQSPDADDLITSVAVDMPTPAAGYLLNAGGWFLDRRRVLFGSPDADALASSASGLTELLYLSIRRGDRRFTRPRAAELYWHLDAAGVRKVVWSVWGKRPDPIHDFAVDAPSDEEASAPKIPPPPIDWWSTYRILGGEPFRFTPREIGRLTWPQVLCLIGSGKPPLGSTRTIGSFQDIAEMRARRRQNPWLP
jgi:hypothetical protein